MSDSRARRSLKRAAIVAFVVVAIAAFVYALVDSWRATHGELPSVWRLLLAGALWVIGLAAGAVSWTTLLGEPRFDVGAGFVVSQLGKYLPGGVFQAAGQVGLARARGVGVRRGAVGFTVQAVVQAAAGAATLVLLAAAWTDARVVVRALLVLGALAAVVVLDRRWMVFALSKLPRTRHDSAELVPPQRAILVAWAALVVTLLSSSCAYLVLLGAFGHVASPLLVVAAFAAAWTAGFLAVPIPAGLGIREAVLAAVLASTFPSSVIVAASVYHRLVTVATEGVVGGALAPVLRRKRSDSEVEPEPV